MYCGRYRYVGIVSAKKHKDKNGTACDVYSIFLSCSYLKLHEKQFSNENQKE
jgi:hypothetical protein